MRPFQWRVQDAVASCLVADWVASVTATAIRRPFVTKTVPSAFQMQRPWLPTDGNVRVAGACRDGVLEQLCLFAAAAPEAECPSVQASDNRKSTTLRDMRHGHHRRPS